MFNYTSLFNNESLEHEAKAVCASINCFVKQTMKKLVEIGNLLWQIHGRILEIHGNNGKNIFEQWIKSEEFGSTKYVADAAMVLAPWYNNLTDDKKEIVLTSTKAWSINALKLLPKLTEDVMKAIFSSEEKNTSKIKEIIKSKTILKPGEIGEEDWNIVTNQYEWDEEASAEMYEALSSYGELNTENLEKMLIDKGYNPEKVLGKRKNKSSKTPEKVDLNGELEQEEEQEAQEEEITQIPISLVSESIEKGENLAPTYKAKTHSSFEKQPDNVEKIYSQAEVDEILKQNHETIQKLVEEKDQLNKELEKTQQIHSLLKIKLKRQDEEISSLKNQVSYLSAMEEETYRLREELNNKNNLSVNQADNISENSIVNEELMGANDEDEEFICSFSNFTILTEKVKKLSEKIVEHEIKEQNLTYQITTLTEKLSALALLELPLSDEQLYIGAFVKVIADEYGWIGQTGKIIAKDEQNYWWVNISQDDGSVNRKYFKANQLSFCIELPQEKPEKILSNMSLGSAV